MKDVRPEALGQGTQEPDEPLADSAPLAWAEAPQRCYRDSKTGDTCLWFHRVWQYLRLLGFLTAVRTNTDFFLRCFRDCARTGRYPVVLISGTADYSMLAHLKCAYDDQNSAFQTTLVDRCRTPLMLNRWYADRCGVALTTVADDVLEYAAEHRFDLVCTHSFLGFFDGESRRRLVARWHALLRPGGLVVTTQRVRPNMDVCQARYPDRDARDLSARVATAARAFHQPLTVDPDELAEAVYQFAIRRGTYVIRTNREITDLFEAHGFDIEQADDGTNDERSRDRLSLPAGKDTYRMRIVARKR